MTTPQLLFHGTQADFERPRAGGYDQVFWTADSSAVAQTYLPAAGATTRTGLWEQDLGHKLWPRQFDPWTEIAARMGFVVEDAKWDAMGCATSFRYPAAGLPTYSQICDHIEQALGYERRDGLRGHYELKTDCRASAEQQWRTLPAEFRLSGHLCIVSGHEHLRLYRMAEADGDLTQKQYHQLETFEKIRNAGWDGVVINDFTRSNAWGNVGHTSYGFFEPAIGKLHIERIPANHFDWREHDDPCSHRDSPEFTRWKAATLARAVAEGAGQPLRASRQLGL